MGEESGEFERGEEVVQVRGNIVLGAEEKQHINILLYLTQILL